MAENNTIDFASVLRGRRATYQFLARLFRVEVDQDFLDTLMTMKYPAETGNKDVDEGYKLIRQYLSRGNESVLQDLAKDYVHAFIGLGNDAYSAAYPYESVYTSPRRLLMQDARDEVLVIYRSEGLEKTESWGEGEDHISLELEYEQIIGERALNAYEKGDTETCLSYLMKQRNFLQDHLCSWYPMMADDIKKFALTDFYRGVGLLTSGFLENDLEFLNELLEDNDVDDPSDDARESALEDVNANQAPSDEETASAKATQTAQEAPAVKG